MEKKTTLYVAYGSNLNLDQMAFRCPTAKVAGTAQLQGYELLFRGASARGGRGAVATVEPKEGSSVPVLLWRIQEKDEQALDRYEGFPHFYRKEQLPVNLGGRELSAMVYIMYPGLELGVPSDYYYDTIAQGYESAGFDLAVLDAAVEESYTRSLTDEPDDRQDLFVYDEEEFAQDLEEMVSNPSVEMTERWKEFARSAAESYGAEKDNFRLYCSDLITEMRNIYSNYDQDIIDRIYETGGIDHLALESIARFLEQGGDPAQIETLAGDGQFMCL